MEKPDSHCRRIRPRRQDERVAWGPGIKPGSKNYDICGGLDFMATFAALGGVKLPENDLEGKPTIFDSYNMAPLLFGNGKWGPHLLVLIHRR